MDCVEACPSGALEVTGERLKLEDVVDEACRDEIFYLNSGGGVTLSGGEPLSQPEFARRFLEACQERSIHTVLDTSGQASWPVMQRIAGAHGSGALRSQAPLRGRGIWRKPRPGNDLILENLRRTLDAKDTSVWIRIPLDSRLQRRQPSPRGAGPRHPREMGAEKVPLLGFHQWGRSKYRALGREYPFDEVDPLPQESLESAKRLMEARGLTVTIDH